MNGDLFSGKTFGDSNIPSKKLKFKIKKTLYKNCKKSFEINFMEFDYILERVKRRGIYFSEI